MTLTVGKTICESPLTVQLADSGCRVYTSLVPRLFSLLAYSGRESLVTNGNYLVFANNLGACLLLLTAVLATSQTCCCFGKGLLTKVGCSS